MILVTGAGGRVGRALTSFLLSKGKEVRGLSRDGSGCEGAEIIKGDIMDSKTVEKAAEDAECVYHLAAVIDQTGMDARMMWEINVTGTKNVIAASWGSTFVYLSSTAVYGNNDGTGISEDTRINPSGTYGKSKAAAENEVLKNKGMVVRSPVVYGKGFDEGFFQVMYRLEKGRMPTIGSGKNLIQWIHIDDLVRALVLAGEKGSPGQVYLVAGKEARTQSELISMLAGELGAEEPSARVNKSLAGAVSSLSALSSGILRKKPSMLPEHVRRIASSRTFEMGKARRELGFEPSVGYEEGVREIVREYLSSRRQRAET